MASDRKHHSLAHMRADIIDSSRNRGIAWLLEQRNFSGQECLLWPGHCNHMGYGIVPYRRKLYKAHRVMCFWTHGEPVGDRIYAAHNCGNGRLGCVNPHHLEWKTHSENMRDAVRHGRYGGNSAGNRGKLTPEQQAEIRSLKGKTSTLALAPKYGVCPDTIGRIWRGKTYRSAA